MTHNNISDEILQELNKQISAQMGLHFSEKNWSNLKRGICSAASDFGLEDTESCGRWLLSSPLTRDRLDMLASHLTIGETYFFREMNTFNALEKHVIPALLLERNTNDRRLRIWSAGCSSGEEPYSLAILLSRILPNVRDWNISILATDVNPRSLQKASDGVYSEWSFRAPPSWLKESYFKQKGKRYELLPHIKQMVTFSSLNLARDVYPSLSNGTNAIDIIFCRNVIMYFSQALQKRVITQFHHALLNGGWLIVSPSEASSALFPQFATVNFPGAIFFLKGAERQEIYQKWIIRTINMETSGSPAIQAGLDNPFALSFSNQAPGFPIAPQPAFVSPFSKQEGLPEGTHTLSGGIPQAATEQEASTGSTGTPDTQNTPESASYEQALASYKQGRYEETIDMLLQRRDSTEDGDVSDLLARAYANQGQFAEALIWCEHAIHAEKLNPGYHYLRATILQEQNQFEEAANTLRRVLFLDHDFVLAYFALGNLSRQQGRLNDAAKHFANARTLLQQYAPEDILPESDGITAGRLKEIVESMLSTR